MGNPYERPALACPACGERTLYTRGYVLCEVLDCPGPAVRSHGHGPLITVPVVANEGDEPRCECNMVACGWTGTIAEAKRKAENSNPTPRSAPSG